MQVLFATLHQANGALLLAWAVMLMLWLRRLLVQPGAQGSEQGQGPGAESRG